MKQAGYDISRLENKRKLVLITGHRRENFGEGFMQVCMAIKKLQINILMLNFVYPMHLNPNVREPISLRCLINIPLKYVFYRTLRISFVHLFNGEKCNCIDR